MKSFKEKNRSARSFYPDCAWCLFKNSAGNTSLGWTLYQASPALFFRSSSKWLHPVTTAFFFFFFEITHFNVRSLLSTSKLPSFKDFESSVGRYWYFFCGKHRFKLPLTTFWAGQVSNISEVKQSPNNTYVSVYISPPPINLFTSHLDGNSYFCFHSRDKDMSLSI